MAVASQIYRARSRRARRSRSQSKGTQFQRSEQGLDTDALSHIISGHSPASEGASASIQTKLSISSPNDPQEKEADHVADQIVSHSSDGSEAQRQCDSCEEEEAQTKLQLKGEEEEAQPKLQLKGEEEEESMQMKLQRKGEEEEAQPKLQRMEEEEEAQPKLQLKGEEEEESMQMKLQRQEEEEEAAQPKLQLKGEEEEEAQTQLQRVEEEEAQTKTESNSTSPATPSLSAKLQSRKGKGSPLPKGTQQQMESHFKRDLSQVRVHTDSESESMSQQIRAQAFTLGKDIYFNRGKFNPETREGKHLLAHELTHVMQQNKSLERKIQKQAAPAANNCNPCPNPTGHAVDATVRPNLQFGTLGPGRFGNTAWPGSAAVPFVSVWHRERRNCNTCGPDNDKAEWDLCPRSMVVRGRVDVIIDATEINRRGAGGERWFIDCDNVFSVAHTTSANAAATMARPVRITVGMTRRHELYHVSVGERLLRERLQNRADIHQICPYNKAEIAQWKADLEADIQTDSAAFLQSNPDEPNEEQNARNHTC